MFPLLVSTALLLGSTTAPPAPAPTDTLPTRCQTLPASTDSVRQALSIQVEPRDAAVQIPPDFARAIGQAVASQLKLPEPLDLTVLTTGFPVTDSVTVRPTLSTHAYVTLFRRGTASEPVVIGGSLNLDLDEALANAVHSADSAKAFPAFPASVSGDSVLLSVRLETVPTESPTEWVKVKDIALPRYHLEAPARSTTPIQAPYPDEAKARAVDGLVTLTFVVDEFGKVIMPTVDATRADYREFLQSTLRTLPTLQFTPATLSGCPVRQHLVHTFTFTPPGGAVPTATPTPIPTPAPR